MSVKKTQTQSGRSGTKAKSSSAAKAAPAVRLQNLAARPASFDEATDDQLVDHSGVFRVTAAIQQAQTGHAEDDPRFASDSLVIQAQKDGFREDGPTIDDVVEERVVEDLASRAEKRARLATLTQRAQARGRPRR